MCSHAFLIFHTCRTRALHRTRVHNISLSATNWKSESTNTTATQISPCEHQLEHLSRLQLESYEICNTYKSKNINWRNLHMFDPHSEYAWPAPGLMRSFVTTVSTSPFFPSYTPNAPGPRQDFERFRNESFHLTAFARHNNHQ